MFISSIFCCHPSERCTPCFCSQREIHEVILHFTVLYIVGTSIACRSSRLLGLFYVQVGFLKMQLKLDPCAIICRINLPHAISICIFLRCQNFCGAHVFQITIRKWCIPRDGKLFSHLYLIKQDLNWVLDIMRCLHLFLVPHRVSW